VFNELFLGYRKTKRRFFFSKAGGFTYSLQTGLLDISGTLRPIRPLNLRAYFRRALSGGTNVGSSFEVGD
jgi:hypothetical protein